MSNVPVLRSKAQEYRVCREVEVVDGDAAGWRLLGLFVAMERDIVDVEIKTWSLSDSFNSCPLAQWITYP